MKLKRSKKDEEDRASRRRHTIITKERMQNSSTYAYSSRRSEEALNVGRKADRAKAKVKAAKTTNFWLQRFGLIILTIAFIVSAFNVLSLSSSPRVMPFNGSEELSLTSTQTNQYETAASKVLASSIWNGNKITVDTEAISNKLIDEFPDIKTVSVAIPIAARRPVIYVGLSQPALVLVEPNGAYEINESGTAISKAAAASAFVSANLPIVTDQSGLNIELHNQALSTTYVSFIQEVYGQLSAKSITVSSMTLLAGSNELDVSLAGEPYYIKFNLENDDPKQQAGTYLATISYLKGQNITPSKYVDVRIDGRAYYQ
jgi:hypothetical protein